MNEFTKEELEYLKSCPSVGCYNGLIEKIQSMIDSYCEHEWENTCCGCTLRGIYCHKCGKDMGDLKARYDE